MGVQGSPLTLLGECSVDMVFERMGRTISFSVQVADVVTSDVILGRDFLQKNQCSVEMGLSNQLWFMKDKNTIPLGGQETMVALVIDKPLTLPAHFEMKVMLNVPKVLRYNLAGKVKSG